MHDHHWLAERFQEHRPHLRAVASRILGSAGEADDALQEAWLKLSRADTDGVSNPGGWLTTVVARVCIDLLHTRNQRREQPAGADLSATFEAPSDRPGPEQEALLAEGVGQALLVVLDTLNPAERVAFVLHDMFAMPYDQIATILERSAAAARQLASRARRRVQGAAVPDADPARQRAIVEAFLAAAHRGDLDTLIAMLAPDVALHADPTAVRAGASGRLSGAAAVAAAFSGRSQAIRPALIDGAGGAVLAGRRRLWAVFTFTIANGKISGIELVGDPERLLQLDIVQSHTGAVAAP